MGPFPHLVETIAVGICSGNADERIWRCNKRGDIFFQTDFRLFQSREERVNYATTVPAVFVAMRFTPPFLFVALVVTTMDGHAVDASSPVVGFLRYDCPANSDTRVSVPFHPSPRWAGKLSAVPAPQSSSIVRLTLSGTPAFAPGELTTSPHFLLCRDPAGPEGRHFAITAHTSSSVDVKATLAELSGLGPNGLGLNGLVSVIPAWTIETLFPPTTQTTFHPSTGNLATGRGSELLLFDEVTAGSSIAPSRRLFVTTSGWFEAGSGYPAAGEIIIAPGQSFIIRHPSDVAATRFVALSQVYGGVVKLPVRVTQGKRQDTVIALPRPLPQTLAELDFGPVFVESIDLTPGGRRDELHLFDNGAPPPGSSGQNKSSAAVYFRHAGAWVREAAPSFPNADAVVIEPATGLLIRKAPGADNVPLFWSNAPLYDVTAP